MPLRQDFVDRLKAAMKAGQARTVSTVRLIQAALKDRDIAARGKGKMDGIDEAEILQMLQTMIKQRRESIQHYEQGGRVDLVQQEQEEIAVIEGFLPRQMGDAEAEAAIKAIVAELGATSIKDMGRVMAALRQRFAGTMDFGKASGVIKGLLK
jgi:uncharacterized protein